MKKVIIVLVFTIVFLVSNVPVFADPIAVPSENESCTVTILLNN